MINEAKVVIEVDTDGDEEPVVRVLARFEDETWREFAERVRETILEIVDGAGEPLDRP
jgi:hypothetical protein